MMSRTLVDLTSRGNTPLIRVPIVLLFFSSTNMALDLAKRKDSPDSRGIRREVAPTRHQLTLFFMFFRRLTFFFMVTFIKLPKLVRLRTLFFLLGCIHNTSLASLLSAATNLASLCITAPRQN